jgi:hypothetical protein
MADSRADDMCNRKKQELLVALKQKDVYLLQQTPPNFVNDN